MVDPHDVAPVLPVVVVLPVPVVVPVAALLLLPDEALVPDGPMLDWVVEPVRCFMALLSTRRLFCTWWTPAMCSTHSSVRCLASRLGTVPLNVSSPSCMVAEMRRRVAGSPVP